MSQLLLGPVLIPDSDDIMSESIPMTLQIAMLAKDGWVLASERRTGEVRNQMGGADRTFGIVLSESKKLWYLQKETAAMCCSGGDVSRRVTEYIAQKLIAGNFDYNQVGTEFRQALTTLGARSVAPYGSDRILAVFYNDPNEPHLWCLDIAGAATVIPFTTWALSGDWGNSAKLLPQLYYTRRSVERLTELAVFTLEFGHQCNPSSVGGPLDVVVGDAKGNAKELSQEQIEAIRAKWNAFDEQVAQLLGTSIATLSSERSRPVY